MPRTKKSKPGYWRRKAEAEAEESATKALNNLEAELEGQPNVQEGEDGNPDEIKPAPTDAFKSQLDRFRIENPNATPQEIQQTANAQRRAEKASRKRPLTDNDADPPLSKKQKKQKKKGNSKYAPPSKYAHLPKLTDILDENLICVFVGTNPGIRTAEAGHAYAHPSNLFWKLLHQSGCTDVRLPPEHDVFLPEWYAMGNTNIVERPSKDAAELSKAEMTAGAPVLDKKIGTFRPEAVCIVGKGIYEAIFRHRHGREIKKEEFSWGWQPESERMGKLEASEDGWAGTPVFVASSTSGLSASLKPAEKLEIWKPFGEWVKGRRKERFGTEGRIDKVENSAGVVSVADEAGHDDDVAEVAEAANEEDRVTGGADAEAEVFAEPGGELVTLEPDVTKHFAAIPAEPGSAKEHTIYVAEEKHEAEEHELKED